MSSAAAVEEKKAIINDDLQPDETKVKPLVEQLLRLVQDEGLDETEVLRVASDEYFARRCLLANQNDAGRAYRTGAAGLRWRSKYRPSQLRCSDFGTAASQDLWALVNATTTTAGCHGADAQDRKKNWPVAFCTSKNWNPWAYGMDEYVKMMAFLMESLERAMDPEDPYARMYLIVDFKGNC
jgi:hypothetical protein